MAAPQSWIKNPNAPFGYKHGGRNMVCVNGDIIVIAEEDNHIYKFNIKSKTWSKHQFGDYKNIEFHAVCCSKDGKQLFIYDGYENKILIIIDIETMKIIKEINNMINTNSYPSIICDEYNNKLIHVIGGHRNNKHFTVNIENGDINTICSLKNIIGNRGLFGGMIVNISNSNENSILYTHSNIEYIYKFNMKTNKWVNLNVKMPFRKDVLNCGYILSNDGENIIIFGGYDFDNNKSLTDIYIYNIKSNQIKKSNMVSPNSGMLNATITMDNNIHLFKRNKHYIISLDSIISNVVFNELPKEEKEEIVAYNINQNNKNENKEIENDELKLRKDELKLRKESNQKEFVVILSIENDKMILKNNVNGKWIEWLVLSRFNINSVNIYLEKVKGFKINIYIECGVNNQNEILDFYGLNSEQAKYYHNLVKKFITKNEKKDVHLINAIESDKKEEKENTNEQFTEEKEENNNKRDINNYCAKCECLLTEQDWQTNFTISVVNGITHLKCPSNIKNESLSHKLSDKPIEILSNDNKKQNENAKNENKEIENENEEFDEVKEWLTKVKEVKEWLTNTVQLPEYVDNFVDGGYDDMPTIIEGIEDEDLIDIGIKKKEHRKKILIFITKYKNNE